MSGTWQSLKKQTCGLFSIVAFAYMAPLDFSPSMEHASAATAISMAALTAVWNDLGPAHALCRLSPVQDLLHAPGRTPELFRCRLCFLY